MSVSSFVGGLSSGVVRRDLVRLQSRNQVEGVPEVLWIDRVVLVEGNQVSRGDIVRGCWNTRRFLLYPGLLGYVYVGIGVTENVRVVY